MLRTLEPRDFSHVMELGASLFRPKDEMPQLYHALDVCFLELSYVAVENGRILGFTIVCPPMTTVSDVTILPFRSGSCELAFFGVSPACQGRGIGSRLLKETLHTLFQRSYSSIWLLVDKTNEGALQMYERRGFRRRGQQWPDGAPEACWLMCLTTSHESCMSSSCEPLQVYHESRHIMLTCN
jgi:ribosomal protein S18 acetylase RimI-like enzyme